ncbi:hypothetical protein [Chryseobacterium sp. OV279]|uniref:hypothetical protein n=1 Tax=Chryseobacterium sp. OV279 TaxID=1500285 RepID=UPI000919C72C|nr:hypothetical protein [Chryseobacterium sp. OV279]SHE90634.1 hypothetical protein SAMN02787100_1110 [Chryseobacterium sp. OV279]
MDKILVFFFIFLGSDVLFSQNINGYNKILKIENLPFNKHEVRIYRKQATSIGLEMFRLSQDHMENWTCELYKTESTRNQQVTIKKSNTNSPKNIDLVWLKILDTNLLHLPQWKSIQYKLEKKNKEYFTEDGEIMSSKSTSTILDGVSYYVKIKNDKKENQFEYNNPESYLKIYPNVDELIFFKELLDVVSTEFKVFP